MDLRLGKIGGMLASFLQDDLSEAHLGLYAGARAHLERFRTLLNGFYAAKLGYYPPPSADSRTTIFELDVIRTMKDDFEALFEYLVDENFEASRSLPASAQGGICTLQSVQSFDARHKFKTLDHPMPLLPEIKISSSRRMSWFIPQNMKPGSKERASSHVALLKSTNQNRMSLLDNDLVRAYRKFEDDSIYSPLKADKLENLSIVDARKVRWILIYTIYQTLKQATEPPSEVRDTEDAPYNLCISTANIPPWTDELPVHSFVRSQTAQITRNSSFSTEGGWSSSTEHHSPSMSSEIKPDIDYFALAHRDDHPEATSLASMTSPKIPGRRASLTAASVKRSLSIFSRQQQEKPAPLAQRRSSQYHEIVVHGYGNGTNDVAFTPSTQQSPEIAGIADHNATTTERSHSISSASSKSSGSEEGSAATSDTSIAADSPTTSYSGSTWNSPNSSLCVRGRMTDFGFDRSAPRPVSACEASAAGAWPGTQYDHLLEAPVTPMRSTARSASLVVENRKAMEPEPLNIRKSSTSKPAAITTTLPDLKPQVSECEMQMPSPQQPNAWDDIKALMEVRASRFLGDQDHIQTEWEMYNDLGGLTELKAC